MVQESNHDAWQRLAGEPARYYAEKQRLVEQVLEMLEGRYPGLASQVEMVDVASPVTYSRFTGNWQGSPRGWLLTPHNLRLYIPRTLRHLRSFYLAGHWTMPGGGLPVALLTAQWAVQVMCRDCGRRFALG